MHGLARCPGARTALDLLLCVALNSPSQNQDGPESEASEPSRVPPRRARGGPRTEPAPASRPWALACHNPMPPLPSHPEPPPAPSLASPGCPLRPNALPRPPGPGDPVPPGRPTTETLPSERPAGPPGTVRVPPRPPLGCWGFRHPLFIAFPVRCPGHVAGREGGPGWEGSSAPAGGGLGFSRRRLWPVPPALSLLGDGAPTPAAVSPLRLSWALPRVPEPG